MVRLATVSQSGALPFAYREKGLRLLLVTSTGTGRWIIPKGHIEPGLTACESAEAEALEEAGVVGIMNSKSIGSYSYTKRPERGGGRCRVRVFAMQVSRVLDDYQEAAIRKRRWFSVEKAAKAVHEPGLRTLIERFAKEYLTAAA